MSVVALSPPCPLRTANAVPSSDPSDDRRVVLVLKLFVASIVLFQRFAIPINGISILVPTVAVVMVALIWLGRLQAEADRLIAYLAAATTAILAALAGQALGHSLSVTSLLLLIMLYVPFGFRVNAGPTALRQVLEFFCTLMVPISVIACVQWAAQPILGWRFHDILDFLPQQYLVQGYNTAYPLYYGSPIWKSNAIVFLEPSFCSQFLALAIICQLLVGRHRWRIPLFLFTMVTTVSGTGILLLAVGAGVLILCWGGKRAVVIIVSGLVVVLAALASPAGAVFASRSQEFSSQGSSGNARFILPYQQAAGGLMNDLPTLLTGRGPGSIERDAQRIFNPADLETNFPIVPKVFAEYGLVAGIAFVLFIGQCLLRGQSSPTLTAAILLIYFYLSSSLLQPHTTFLCLVLAGWLSRPWSERRSTFQRRGRGAAATRPNLITVAPLPSRSEPAGG